MMDEKKECLPEGVVTMLLHGYVNTIKSLKNALYLAIASQIVTMVAFAWYVISRWYTVNKLLWNTRNWLIGSTKSSFHAVLEEAKITPRQIEICELRFVKGMTNYQIAAQLNISDKTVEKELNTAYKQITNVLASL